MNTKLFRSIILSVYLLSSANVIGNGSTCAMMHRVCVLPILCQWLRCVRVCLCVCVLFICLHDDATPQRNRSM